MRVHDEWTQVPCVSRFQGIVISMYYNETIHPGRPHFHAIYAGVEATFDIESLEPIVGRLPRRTHRLVIRWAALHRDELLRDWERCRSDQLPLPIDPLP